MEEMCDGQITFFLCPIACLSKGGYMQHFVPDGTISSEVISDTFLFSRTSLAGPHFVVPLSLLLVNRSISSGVGIGALGISFTLNDGNDLGPSNDELS
jgi:hypothetical protein